MSKLKVLLAVLVAVCVVTPALAGGNANFVLGMRSLDNDFKPVEDQTAIGGTVDWAVSDWPINLEAGAHFSTDSDDIRFGGSKVDVKASILELCFGVNKSWEVGSSGNMFPFVGGGLTAVTTKVEVEGDDADDTSFGVYAHGGIFWRLGEAFNIGVDGRVVRGAEADLNGDTVDVDYLQTSLILGWAWD